MILIQVGTGVGLSEVGVGRAVGAAVGRVVGVAVGRTVAVGVWRTVGVAVGRAVYRDVGVELGEWFWTLIGIAAVAIDVLLELYPVTDTVWLPSASVAEFQATQ